MIKKKVNIVFKTYQKRNRTNNNLPNYNSFRKSIKRNLLKGDGLGVCGPYKWSFGSFLLGPYIGNTKMYTNKNERKHVYIHAHSESTDSKL